MAAKTSCTHSELIAQVFTLEAELDAFEKLMDERDKRYEQRALAQDTAVSAALVSAKEATVTAKAEVDAHLKALNEIRNMAIDQSKTFAVGRVMEEKFDSVKSEIQGIKDVALVRAGASSGMDKMIAYLFGAAGLLAVIFDMYFRR